MRVLVLSQMYPPHNIGGYELACHDVMERWRAAGHEVHVLTTTHRESNVADPPDERARGVRRDLRFYWEDYRLLSPSLRERLRIERYNQRVLADALEETRPDVVSVWEMGAMSLGLLSALVERDIPMVFVICDDWMLYAPDMDAWTRMFAERPRLARIAHALTGVPARPPDIGAEGTFCFISEWTRQRAEERSPWTPARSTIGYIGIDTEDLPILEPTDRPWRGKLVCVGRVEERKGVHVVVEALAQLPDDVTLEVVGPPEPAYRERLDRMATDLGVADRITYALSPRERLATHYREADVFVFPVLWDEPFGLVPVEAMACGTPVVATATGGSGEYLIDDVNCLRVARGDPGAIADAVQRLSADPSLRRRLVEAGSITAEDLTADRFASSLEPWHRAAAERFVHGEPEHRPLQHEVLAARGLVDGG